MKIYCKESEREKANKKLLFCKTIRYLAPRPRVAPLDRLLPYCLRFLVLFLFSFFPPTFRSIPTDDLYTTTEQKQVWAGHELHTSVVVPPKCALSSKPRPLRSTLTNWQASLTLTSEIYQQQKHREASSATHTLTHTHHSQTVKLTLTQAKRGEFVIE